MLRYVSQSYKAIKATRKVCRERFLKATRLSRLLKGTQRKVSQGYKAIKATGEVSRYRFLKATRLSRLQEGDAEIRFSRLQSYQGYWRGMQGLGSQVYKSIKAL